MSTRRLVPWTLTAFGALSVAAMLVFYALEDRSPRFVVAYDEARNWLARLLGR